jgi:hypothetical protein
MPDVTCLGNLLRAMGLSFEESLSGRWVKIRGRECAVYIVEGSRPPSYLTWCARWDARESARYRTPEEAIAAGLRRAGGPAEDRSHMARASEPPLDAERSL